MTDKIKIIVRLAILFLCLIGLFWNVLPKGSYYKVFSLITLLYSILDFNENRNNLISFLILGSFINNFIDEIFGDPLNLSTIELSLLFSLPIIWILKTKKDASKK